MKKHQISTHRLILLIMTCLVILLFISLSSAGQFPCPDTGQTKCFDNEEEIPCPTSQGRPFYGQDANYTINSPSYSKLGYDAVELSDSATPDEGWIMTRDNVTGLIWELKTDDGSINDRDRTYDWDKAVLDYINSLNDRNFGGFSDWRLPSVEELSSLVNAGPNRNAILTVYFENNMPDRYWTSTPYAYGSGRAWHVNFEFGTVTNGTESYRYYVRAVRRK